MALAPPEIRDVILRDGSTLRLRPPHASDTDAVLGFFGALSERSVYWRFHGFPALTPATVEPFLDPDWEESGSLIGALSVDGEGERIVALASFVRLRDPSSAEVAFAVADELQGRGVGTRLLEQLAESAADAGISEFVAEVMPDNRAMLSVFADAGFAVSRRLDGGHDRGPARNPADGDLPGRRRRARPRRRRGVARTTSSPRERSPSSALRRDAARSAGSSSATSSTPISPGSPTR